MSSPLRKIQKNASQYELDQIYKNMTPEQYREGIRSAVQRTMEDVGREYEKELVKVRRECRQAVYESVLTAMDTLSVEMIYELGNILNCYDEEPTYLDQKIDIVQGLYEKAMDSIKDYAGTKYKNDNQAKKVFEKKKKIVKKVFGIYNDNV